MTESGPKTRLQDYIFDVGNVGSILLVLLAGYAVALFFWQVRHFDQLGKYVLENELPVEERRQLFGLLVLGMLAALLIWLAIGALAQRGGGDLYAVLRRASRVSLLAGLLPCLQILAAPAIILGEPPETRDALAPLQLCTVAFMAGLTLAAFWPIPGQKGPAFTAGERVPTGGNWRRYELATALLLALGYTIFMSLLTVGRHNAFETHAFDLGIYDQGFYTLLRYGYMRSTLFGETAIIHSGEHFSPIFYLVAPIYALAQNARTLLILQSLFLAAGAVPVYLLARLKLCGPQREAGRLRRLVPAFVLAVAYLLHPALHGVNNFDFHQIALAIPLLLFSLYFLEAGRTGWFLLFLMLSAFTKEEVALTVIAVGLYVFFLKRRARLGALVILAAAAYFLAVTQFIMPALGGEAKALRFEGMMAPGSSGFAAVALTLFTNPFYTLQYALLDPDKLLFLIQLLLPVLFLPLLAPAAWIVAGPGLATSLLSAYPPQYDIATHYPAIILPSLFFLTVLGMERLTPGAARPAGAQGQHLNRPGRLAIAAVAALLVASLAMNYLYGWLFSRQFSGFPRPDEHDKLLASFVTDIPRSASVSTLSDIAPHLSNREEIYLFR